MLIPNIYLKFKRIFKGANYQKQPLVARKHPSEAAYQGERGVKIEKCIFTTVETSNINKFIILVKRLGQQ